MTVKLPVISGFESGPVSDVLITVGDTVDVGAPLFELQNDKATLELPSDVAGKVRELLVGVGDTVEWDTPLLLVEPRE